MTIQLDFEQFHDACPQVYEEFSRLAFDGVAAGRTRVSSKFIFEMLRWSGKLPKATPHCAFKNSFTSRYSRMFMAQFPAHRDLFEVREIFTA